MASSQPDPQPSNQYLSRDASREYLERLVPEQEARLPRIKSRWIRWRSFQALQVALLELWRRGSWLRDCKEPKNEANIERNKQKFQALKRKYNSKKGKSSGKPGDKPKRKTGEDGKPYVLNKKGAYVLDQKKLTSDKKKEEHAEAQKEFESTMAALEKAAEPTEPPAQAQAHVTSHVRTPGLQAQMTAL
jgi:hypothetical protein